jgi:hypothetical protein
MRRSGRCPPLALSSNTPRPLAVEYVHKDAANSSAVSSEAHVTVGRQGTVLLAQRSMIF